MSINKFFLSNFSANAHVKAALLTTSLHFANCNSAHLNQIKDHRSFTCFTSLLQQSFSSSGGAQLDSQNFFLAFLLVEPLPAEKLLQRICIIKEELTLFFPIFVKIRLELLERESPQYFLALKIVS